MRPNVFEFLKIVSEVHSKEPIVEFGALQLKGHKTPRQFFTNKKFIGCDIQKGESVDRVDDITKSKFKNKSVGTLIAAETFEHVDKIWLAFSESQRILQLNGLFVITMPFTFPFHMLPDYWRLTPQGLYEMLGVFKHRTVLFQGDYNIPHTVFGLASKKAVVLERTKKHLFKNMSRIPGSRVGEGMFLWEGKDQFIKEWGRNVRDRGDWYNDISGRRGKTKNSIS